jgi:hypothetical protein
MARRTRRRRIKGANVGKLKAGGAKIKTGELSFPRIRALSFPRKRESREPQRLETESAWIPAFAGMTRPDDHAANKKGRAEALPRSCNVESDDQS